MHERTVLEGDEDCSYIESVSLNLKDYARLTSPFEKRAKVTMKYLLGCSAFRSYPDHDRSTVDILCSPCLHQSNTLGLRGQILMSSNLTLP